MSFQNLTPIRAGNGIPAWQGSHCDYQGPTMGWLIANHKLAHQIIATHPLKPSNILDEAALVFLKTYVMDPRRKMELLREKDMLDAPGQEPGFRASSQYGSLVGYVIARDGFDEQEIALLREWFESGVLDEELEEFED